MFARVSYHLRGNFIFYAMALLYVALVFTWYFKPPWFIDHLIYLHLATPENLNDLNFWSDSGVSVNPGHHNERWGVLVPIMVFEKIFFFLTPGQSSQALIFAVYIGIFYFLYRIVYVNNGKLSANLLAVFFVLGVHHTKNRATEILADPFGVLYLLVAIYILSKYKEKLSFRHFFIIGCMLAASAFTKIHYGIFVILFLIWIWIWYRSNVWKVAIPAAIIGGILFLLSLDIIMYLLLDRDIFFQINSNTISVLIGYISGGLGVSDGPGNNGWSYEWIKLIVQHNFLPFSFLISTVIIASRGVNYSTILAWSSLSFLLLIIVLSSVSNFPANDSYAFPVYILSIASIAVITSEFKPKELKDSAFILLVFIVCIFALYSIYDLGSVKSDKFFVSYKSLTIVLSTVIFSLILVKKRTIFLVFVYLMIIGSDIFWHNWKNIENHSWWRDGYNWHYDYLNSVESLDLSDGVYQVHFRDWPRIKDRDAREAMYIEPGIRSLNRKSIDIYPKVGSGSLNIHKDTDYILTDYKEVYDRFTLINSRSFVTKDDNKKHSLYLYIIDE